MMMAATRPADAATTSLYARRAGASWVEADVLSMDTPREHSSGKNRCEEDGVSHHQACKGRLLRCAQVNRHGNRRPVICVTVRETHQRASAVTAPRGASERPVNGRHTTSAAAGRSIRWMAQEQTLHDQVQKLRMALSDLKLQVSDLAAACRRE